MSETDKSAHIGGSVLFFALLMINEEREVTLSGYSPQLLNQRERYSDGVVHVIPS